MSSPAFIISVGCFDSLAWLSFSGKGSFNQTSSIKKWGEDSLAKGIMHLIVDLENCHSMDSTFMGTLAGLATTYRQRGGKVTVLTEENTSLVHSFEELGLTSILHINPIDAPWLSQKKFYRDSLTPLQSAPHPPKSSTILDAHLRLCEVNPENNARFANLLEILHKEKPHDTPS